MIIAHKDENGNEQSLFNHLTNVGDGCFQLGEKIGLGYMSLTVGLLHDLGKADPMFQDKIINNTNAKATIHQLALSIYIVFMLILGLLKLSL